MQNGEGAAAEAAKKNMLTHETPFILLLYSLMSRRGALATPKQILLQEAFITFHFKGFEIDTTIYFAGVPRVLKQHDYYDFLSDTEKDGVCIKR